MGRYKAWGRAPRRAGLELCRKGLKGQTLPLLEREPLLKKETPPKYGRGLPFEPRYSHLKWPLLVKWDA